LTSLNIIFGIIIDAFADQRNEKNLRDNDAYGKCFVCGFTRNEIEKKISFEKHTNTIHDPWNYIYYRYYLHSVKNEDYTGIENYVRKNQETHSIKWIPVNKTLVLEDDQSKLNKLMLQLTEITLTTEKYMPQDDNRSQKSSRSANSNYAAKSVNN
jgi:hypothetical protein